MKIVAASDLHGLLPKDVPDGDVLCLCGDIVPLDCQNSTIRSVAWFVGEFLPWVDSLPHKRVLLVGGNHDFFLETAHTTDNGLMRRGVDVMKMMMPGNMKARHSKLVYLFDNTVTIDGVTFYGTPWVSGPEGWAFFRTDEYLKKIWANIPKKCDFLLCHQPPALADAGTVMEPGWNYGAQFGSEVLGDAIRARDIGYVLCGHVHSGNHHPTPVGDTMVVNVSLKDEEYHHSYDFTIIDFNTKDIPF